MTKHPLVQVVHLEQLVSTSNSYSATSFDIALGRFILAQLQPELACHSPGFEPLAEWVAAGTDCVFVYHCIKWISKD